MATTIQISEDLLKKLKERKLYEKESYEELIWALLEDNMELNKQTKLELAISRKQAKEGKTYTWDQVKKEAGI